MNAELKIVILEVQGDAANNSEAMCVINLYFCRVRCGNVVKYRSARSSEIFFTKHSVLNSVI